jgi:DNA-binding NtrC family response regulator
MSPGRPSQSPMSISELGRTLPLGETRPADERRQGSHLFLVMDCARPLAGGARWSLQGIDEVVVGRGPERAFAREGRRLTVRVPDPSVSSAHARVTRFGQAWSIEDAGSTNGTKVDGRRMIRGMLVDGALIELGATFFTVRRVPTPEDSPRDVPAVDAGDAAAGMATLLPSYAEALKALQQVMRSRLPVLLLGESGTGKEMLARAVHLSSGRGSAWVPVNCGGIPETLLESQLFGHAKGAFSGALRDEPGLVRASDGGTLFLDEIGDLPRASQAALLRVLQEREVLPLGSTRPVNVDLRIVSATHRPVDALQGEALRADLYARLAGYLHRLPPLRERREDLGVIVAALLRALARDRAESLQLRSDLAAAMFRHAWPLNVRELEHALASALVFARRGVIELAHLPENVRGSRPTPAASTPPEPVRSDADVRLHDALVVALERHAGNVSHVAREMGRTRMQIHRWMRRLGIDPASLEPPREIPQPLDFPRAPAAVSPRTDTPAGYTRWHSQASSTLSGDRERSLRRPSAEILSIV